MTTYTITLIITTEEDDPSRLLDEVTDALDMGHPLSVELNHDAVERGVAVTVRPGDHAPGTE